MATLPKATTSVNDTAGVPAGGLDVVCIMAPVAANPDITPRFYGSASAIYEQHGYSEGLEYAALHLNNTRKGVLFIGLPIATEGELSHFDTEGNTGTSAVSVTAGSSGPLAEHDGVVEVVKGGTVGTSQIVLGLSLDGGRTFQKLRVGTGNSVAIPYFEVTIALGAGELVEGDTVLTWHGSAPLSDSTGQDLARQALAGQQKAFRSLVLIGDVADSDEATAFLAVLNTYETLNERFIYGRCSVADRLPLAAPSYLKHLTVDASLTFAAAGDTITRLAGSWITDGFAVGDAIAADGTASNDGDLGAISALTATVMTVSGALVNEVIATSTITGRTGLVFAAAGDTITRNVGSWITDGFAVGQNVDVEGTVSNDGEHTITALTATVMTCAGSSLVNETIGLGLATVTRSLTPAAWMAEADDEFASIDDEFRIDLGIGRGRVLSPFSQWRFRRPAAWAASIREYQHDLHIATWFKQNGPTDFDLFDEEGNLFEWDDRVNGGAGVAARFTCLRTWANGPQGAFIALSLTRGQEGSLLSRTHNVAVVNLISTITQLNTEDAAIGASLTLNDDGTATADSLSSIQKRVNDALELGVLVNAIGEGPRASKAVWTPDPAVIFNIPEPTMLGTTETILNGTVHNVDSKVRVRTGG